MILTLLSILMIIGIGIFVMLPIARPGDFTSTEDDQDELEELLERRLQIYKSIREIEFEREMENLSEEDYQKLRNESVKNAAKVIEEADRLLKID